VLLGVDFVNAKTSISMLSVTDPNYCSYCVVNILSMYSDSESYRGLASCCLFRSGKYVL